MLSPFRNIGGASTLGDPSLGRFTYPIEKRRSKENVAALRSAEANLDAFWTKIDDLMRPRLINLDGVAAKRLLSQPRILQRTAEWVEPKKANDRPKHMDSGPVSLDKAFSSLGFDSSRGTEAAFVNPLPPQAKVKTKSTAAGLVEPAATTGGISSDPQPTFTVDARALKVFRIVFFNPATTSTAGEVLWKDFLHAMASTGFMAKKLYSSVWQFRPTSLDVERPIQFHEPHPHNKTPLTVARRFGQRLDRAYGWSGNMFVFKDSAL